MFRKIYYYLQIFPLIANIENWYKIIKLFLLPGAEEILKLRSGYLFKIGHYLDALTVKEIFIDQDYKIKLKSPKVILDIGGNIGTFSILQSIKYPKCKIFTFEPSKKIYQLLVENINLNKSKNIYAKNIGVWSKKSTAKFFKNKASGLSSVFTLAKRDGAVSETVKLDTLSNIFTNNNIHRCDLIKMDCEGAEYEILLKAPKSLFKNIKNLAIEYHDSLTDHKHFELIDLLKKQGYKITVKPHSWENDIGIIYAKR